HALCGGVSVVSDLRRPRHEEVGGVVRRHDEEWRHNRVADELIAGLRYHRTATGRGGGLLDQRPARRGVEEPLGELWIACAVPCVPGSQQFGCGIEVLFCIEG